VNLPGGPGIIDGGISRTERQKADQGEDNEKEKYDSVNFFAHAMALGQF
jgi:hypothetical protein